MRPPVWITVLWLALGAAAVGISAFLQFVTPADDSSTNAMALSMAAAGIGSAFAIICIRTSPALLARSLAAALCVIAVALFAMAINRLL